VVGIGLYYSTKWHHDQNQKKKMTPAPPSWRRLNTRSMRRMQRPVFADMPPATV